MSAEKKCTKCGVIKPLTEFHKNKSSADGLESACSACVAIRGRAWRVANHDRKLASIKQWCDANKERRAAQARERYKTRKRKRYPPSPLSPEALERKRTRNREYQRARSRRLAARTDEQVAADRARLRPDGLKKCRRGEWLPFSDFYETRTTSDGLQCSCISHYNGRLKAKGRTWWVPAGIDQDACFYCSDPATSVDHIVPVSRGGTDAPGNLVPACSSCNCSKNNTDPIKWIAGRVLPDHPGWDDWFQQARMFQRMRKVAA